MSEKHLQSDIQTILKEIFASLIVGISAEELDVHANIFELGLESIAFTEIRGAIKEKLGVNISLRSMLENNSTIHELSGDIAEKMPEATGVSRALPKAEKMPEATGVSRALPKRESLEKPETPSKNGAAVRGLLAKQVSGSLTSQTAVERIVSQQLQLASQQVQIMSKQLELLRKGSSGQTSTQAPRSSQPSTNNSKIENILELETSGSESIKPSSRTKKLEGAGLTAQQQQHLDALIVRVVHRTQESKRLTQAARKGLANPRGSKGFDRSIKEMLYPLHIQRGAGARIWDVDGNEYIDLAMGFGPLLFGHSPPFVIEAIQEQVQRGLQNGPQSHLTSKVVELMCEITGQERVCFCNSGTEAVMGAIRIARATTGRTKIAMFVDSYHGHSDEVLVGKIGNQDGTSRTIPAFIGIPKHKAEQVIMLDYGNLESLDIVKAHAHELAAVLVEPVQSRRPDLQPREFLHQLRQLTLETGIALIVDEVITGFRMHPGGIQALWGIQADISTYGKALGAGLPIGVVAGKASFMDALDGGFWSYGDESYPQADVTFFGGTFFKNPLVMSVVWAVLNHIKDRGPQLQAELTEKTTSLADHLNDYFRQKQLPIQVVHFGSLFRFTYPDDLGSKLFYYHLLSRGIYVAEVRNLFLSTAHTDEDIEQIIGAVKASIEDMQAGGFLPRSPSTVSDRSDEDKKKVQLPLTASQKELWITTQMASGASAAYNESMEIHLRGRLNLQVMGKAVRELANRHEALRTTFSPRGDYQRIAPKIGIEEIQMVDFAGLDNDTRDAEVSQLLALEAGKTFDLEVGPLFRYLVVKLSEEHQILVLTFHHLVVDGWSLIILLSELGVIYSAQCQGVSYELPQPMQYSEYVRRQQTLEQSREMAEAEAYWLQQFASGVPVLDLPTDRRRPSVNRYRGDGQTMKLGESMCDRLICLSGQLKCTLFTTLLAAFMVLLHRLSDQNDIVVGVPTAGQLSAGCPELVGYCTNVLPLRMKVGAAPTFKDYVSSVKKVLLNGYENQIYPKINLIQKLQLPHDLSRTTLIGALFNLDKISAEPEFWGLEVELAPNHGMGAKFDLMFDIAQTSSDLICQCYYNSDIFDSQTIQRWLGHFQTLLSSAAANPEVPLSKLPLLTEAERHQLLVAWNDTQKDYPLKCIHQLLSEQVERTPDAVAVVFEREQITYRELNGRANQLAHHLQQLGVGPEVLVGICVERSIEMVVGLLGILKAGGAYVPLDPSYPQARIAYILQDTQVTLLLTQQGLLSRLAIPTSIECLCLDRDWLTISSAPARNPISQVKSNSLAYLIYTSGSTGKPKGVAIEHGSLASFAQSAIAAYDITVADRILQFASISFDAAAEEIYPGLCRGATLVLRTEETISSSEKFWQKCRDWQLTVIDLPTAYWHHLATALTKNTVLPPSLRLVIIGGEAALPGAWQQWEQWLMAQVHQHKLGRVPELVNTYGPTETTVTATLYRRETSRDPSAHSESQIPIGRPFGQAQVYVLDAEFQPVPIGVRGELYIGGPGLARGYLNQPELTAERLISNPFADDGSRLYKTGDLVRYLPDGNIEFIGRIDNQVKIRGFRIELGEIEATLAGHIKVRSTVVVTREDQPGDKRLVAYIVPEQTAPNAGELRQFLKGKLPEYMVPAAFVTLETIPVTPNGKVDRGALPAPDLDMIPGSDFIAPRTPTEQALADIFGSVLGIEAVGLDNNFFELGGHSLLATQVISRLRETFQIELPLRSIFEAPTVAELDPLIHQALMGGTSQMALPLVAVPREPEILLPLSMAQERLWFFTQLEDDGSATHNMPAAIEFSGQLDVEALEHALNAVVERHEVLRTSIMTVDGRPVQEIAPQMQVRIQQVNLQTLAPNELEHQVQQYIASEEQTPFNLSEAPLLRATLLQIAPSKFAFLVTKHHIISDGWSIGVMMRELTQLYQAYVEGRQPPLKPLPIQYADYALWQRQWLQGEILEQQLTYWTKQLAGAPAILELPTDRPRPAVQTYKGRTERFTLDAGLTKQLKQLAQQQGTTLFMLLLAAFGTLLYRYSGQSDIVIGSPIANRTREEIEPLIGFFVNMLALRLRLGNIRTFAELLLQVRQMTLDAYAHQDLPFARLVEALNLERSLSQNPLFQVMFALQNTPVGDLKLPGLTISPIEFEETKANFALSLSMSETKAELQGVWEYSVDLFEAATIRRMMTHFQTLLKGIVSNPQVPVLQLPLLTSAECQQLLVEWNNTAVVYPQDLCIHQLFEEQVAKTPEAVALVFEEEVLTYQQLNVIANQLAYILQSLGVGSDTLVGICLERSHNLLISVLAVLKAGGVYLPLDPNYPSDRIAYMVADGEVNILITQKSCKDLLLALDPKQTKLLYLDSVQDILKQQSSTNPSQTTTASNRAYIIYTSGSTGKPKGVAVAHRSLVNAYFAWDDAYQLREQTSSHLQMASFSFDVFTGDWVRALCSGAKLVLCPRDLLLEPEHLYGLICRWQIDCAEFVPAVFRKLVDYLESTEQTLSFMKVLVVGSDFWHMGEYQRFRLICGSQTRLINSYGVTEATIDSCYFEAQTEAVMVLEDQAVPIGRPFANMKIYVLDPQLQPVPIGVPGQLYIGGAGLALGYLHRAELTAEKFIPNPFSKGRLYKTGDKACIRADGNIQFLGRIDDQVKIRGFRIEIGEIESILGSHRHVRETAVIVREDRRGNKRLVAYLVPEDTALSSTDLRQFLKEKLPDYMMPTAFILLETLPLTPNGKVDRGALPAPDLDMISGSDFIAPRTTTQQAIADIFAEILGIEAVGLNNNFFELGGHSLLATQVISRLRETFQIELPVRSIFEAPTVVELDLLIHQALMGDHSQMAPPLVAAPRDPESLLPLGPTQESMWILHQQKDLGASYNISYAMRFDGQLNVEALEFALTELVGRHEVLRTSFKTVDGRPVQEIAPQMRVTLQQVNLQTLAPNELAVRVQQYIASEEQTPFNLSEAPLLRATVLQIAPSEFVFLVTIHHIISDGWSMGVIMRELTQLYQAYVEGRQHALVPLPLQYADYVLWQRQWLQGKSLDWQLTYWTKQLAGAPTLLELPTDRRRPQVQTYKGRTEVFALDAGLTKQLKQLAQQQGTTLFMLLLAAFGTILFRYSGQSDIVIGSPIANRTRQEIEPLIGLFINVLALRLRFGSIRTFRELLHQVRQTTIDAYIHQELPFAHLVEALKVERSPSYSPLFQVLFVLQNTPVGELELPGVTVAEIEFPGTTAKFDLALDMTENERGLLGLWEYNVDLFEAATIDRMARNFQRLLEGLVVNPQTLVSQLP